MKRILFSDANNIYKANLHCHSTVSDGALSPEEVKKVYMEKGYSIIAFTEHNVFVSQGHLNDSNFLAINSIEVDIGKKLPKDTPRHFTPVYHLNLYATRQDITKAPPLPRVDYDDKDAINSYIADVAKMGFIVCYNHPHWSLQTYEDYGKLRGCFAMEIYNHNCEVDDGFTGNHSQAFDEMLRTGHNIFCVATDDNHNRGPAHLPDKDSFGGFINISSPSLGYGDVIKSLANGDFYASQGPEIYEIAVDESGKQSELCVRCSPAQAINVFTRGRRCYMKTGEGLTEARFTLSGDEGYVRIVCRDKEMKNAFSNAYWL